MKGLKYDKNQQPKPNNVPQIAATMGSEVFTRDYILRHTKGTAMSNKTAESDGAV